MPDSISLPPSCAPFLFGVGGAGTASKTGSGAPPREVSALPPQQSQPARAYAPPRPDTADLGYRPSVTEGTTKLLERERD